MTPRNEPVGRCGVRGTGAHVFLSLACNNGPLITDAWRNNYVFCSRFLGNEKKSGIQPTYIYYADYYSNKCKQIMETTV